MSPLTPQEPLRDFVQELADEPCKYGDNCPLFGSNHGRCLHCKARTALAAAPASAPPEGIDAEWVPCVFGACTCDHHDHCRAVFYRERATFYRERSEALSSQLAASQKERDKVCEYVMRETGMQEPSTLYDMAANLVYAAKRFQRQRDEMARQLEAAGHQLAAFQRREAALREALQLDKPWPAADVLERLADAATHLLAVHGCDAHGWEGVSVARAEAKQIAVKVRAALASPDPEKEPTP